MKKTKDSITKKYDSLLAEVKYRSQCKLINKKKELLMKYQDEAERKYSSYERKILSYIKKKEVEYDRKCKNEIRKLEWKEERVYKTKKKVFNLVEFAAELMQENSKLRDTDISGNTLCISCGKFKTWKELAWWHRWSRRIKNIMLCLWNINAQCNGCNFTTWPRWDKVASDRVNMVYDENLAKKYWQSIVEQLKEWSASYFKNDYDENWVIWTLKHKKSEVDKYLEETYIPELIRENELRWKWKDFYSPSRKWREIWTKYLASKNS